MEYLIELEKMVGKNEAVVVDSSMRVTSRANWIRAATLVIEKDAYTLFPRPDGSVIRTPKFTMPFPLVVALNRYVAYVPPKSKTPNNYIKKSIILERDGYICQYCGKYGDTVDHILPESRGGLHSWENLCAACKKCNNNKSNRTPQEAGLNVPVIPKFYDVNRISKIQSSFYNALNEISF